MLVPDRQITFIELSQILIFPDHDQATRFYVVPKSPRLASDEQGQLQISSMLYGHKQGETLNIDGGQVNLTTTLALTKAEHSTLVALLSARLTVEARPSDPTPILTIVSPEWLTGHVCVRLTDRISAVQSPSMMGDNECTFAIALSNGEAKTFEKALADGLPDASITYEMQVSAATITQMSQTSQQFNVHIDRTAAIAYPLILTGSLKPYRDALERNGQIIAL